MGKGYILVEGHGEVRAAHNLVVRVSHRLGSSIVWTPPRRLLNLHQWDSPRRGGVKRAAELTRSRPDASALLILRDEDDTCPRVLAPTMAARLRSLALPFPVAYVLLHPEYEVLFLPCLDRMGAQGFPDGLVWDRDSWEARRGIKEWLSGQLPRGRAYKPTVSQLPMTRLLKLDRLAAAGVPSYGSLERALAFLSEHEGGRGEVYPG